MATVRLDKYLSSQTNISRKDVKNLIRQGRIRVNGQVNLKAEHKIETTHDHVIVDEKPVIYKKHLYLMMNKPAGVVSASRDAGQKTVLDLVPDELFRKRLFPAGRLDKDTEGLLIITDDGDFAHTFLSPKNKVVKIYQAVLDRRISALEISSFAMGLKLEDGTQCMPAELRILSDEAHPTVEVHIFEGKYHQIKRMFRVLDVGIEYLKRIQIGRLPLDGALKPGECRELSEKETELILKSDA